MDRYNVIVIGAGHNGLVCAAYLARNGKRVLLVEAAESTGGLAAAREFHPGFQGCVAHSLSHFSNSVANDLDLASHGYDGTSKPLSLVGLNPDGKHVVVADDAVNGATTGDSVSFKEYKRLLQHCADALSPSWQKKVPSLSSREFGDLMTFAGLGLKLKFLGKKDMREFLRIVSLPMRDLMDENFDNETLKAMLCWDGLIGSKLAPRSPNAAVLGLLYRMAEKSGGAHAIPDGGVASLIDALTKSAVAAGCQIRCGSRVERIVVEGDSDGLAATGVVLAGGETIVADTIVSAADPKTTFLDLVGVEHLDIGFTNRIRRLRCDGFVAKLHLALNSQPEFQGIDSPAGRMIIAPTMDSIEFAYDFAKYGELPDEPVLEVVVPSLHDASLAPDGQHVLSAHVMYVPYKLKGGWDDDARQVMSDRAIQTIAQYAPGIRDQIVASEFLTPLDLERNFNVTGGHWHHTEMAMDQMLMMRPTYGAAQYRTPIPGLYISGAGSHPGGDLVGAAGRNTAQVILR